MECGRLEILKELVLKGTNINPDDDINGDCYVNAYVTDPAAGNQTGSNDVDDGDAVLTSPILDLSSYSTPHIHYYRWFANAYRMVTTK